MAASFDCYEGYLITKRLAFSLLGTLTSKLTLLTAFLHALFTLELVRLDLLTLFRCQNVLNLQLNTFGTLLHLFAKRLCTQFLIFSDRSGPTSLHDRFHLFPNGRIRFICLTDRFDRGLLILGQLDTAKSVHSAAHTTHLTAVHSLTFAAALIALAFKLFGFRAVGLRSLSRLCGTRNCKRTSRKNRSNTRE